MTMDSIPKLFSQLRDVFPQLETHSYFELGPDVKVLSSKFQGSQPHLPEAEAWSFVSPRLIWTIFGARGNLHRYTVRLRNVEQIYIRIRNSATSEGFCIMRFMKNIEPQYIAPDPPIHGNVKIVVSQEAE